MIFGAVGLLPAAIQWNRKPATCVLNSGIVACASSRRGFGRRRSSSLSRMVKPILVHASVDGTTKVVEEELAATSDAALAQNAVDLVKNAAFQPLARSARCIAT
jgi:hypothetical protein